MPAPNPASRVHACLQRVGAIPGNIGMVEGLAKMFQMLNAPDALTAGRRVSHRLELLNRQLDDAEHDAVAHGIPTDLYARQVVKARNAANTQALHTNFEHVRGQITPDALLAFAWLAHMLPAEHGNDIDAAVIAELLQNLREARADPLLKVLPGPLRAFIVKHLDALISALEDYQLTGSGPLEQAINNMVTDVIVVNEQAVADLAKAPEPTRQFWKKAAGAIGKTVKAAEQVGKVADAIDKVQKLVDKAPGLVKFVKGLLMGPSDE